MQAALNILSDERVQQSLLRPCNSSPDSPEAKRHKLLHALLWNAATEYVAVCSSRLQICRYCFRRVAARFVGLQHTHKAWNGMRRRITLKKRILDSNKNNCGG